jgi:hypothetical protein
VRRRFLPPRPGILGQFQDNLLEEIRTVKSICRYLSLPFGLALCMQLAHAQNTFDIGIGFGAAQDKASSTGIDQTSLNSCTPVGGTDTLTGAPCVGTPSLNGFMLGFGGRVMFWKHFGVGASVSLQPSQQTYANLQPAIPSIGQASVNLNDRVIFYDFDGIYQPVGGKRAALQIEGGVGGANMRFYEAQSSSSTVLGSSNTSQYAQSVNHFQVHVGAGVRVYLTGNLFIRPQFDFRYVPNFDQQFGRNWVTEETVWVGYSFGER